MRTFVIGLRIAALMSIFLIGNLSAQDTARLVKAEVVWSSEKHVVATDLVRFNDAWIMVCCENSTAYQQEGVLRLITSKQTLPWESLAIVESPTKGKLLRQPRLSVQPDGHLMLTAVGIVANPQSTQPLSQFGGTIQTLTWSSIDGRNWSHARPVGNAGFIQGKCASHDKTVYSYTRGFICGNAQTIKIESGVDQQSMKEIYTKTLAEFFPNEASLTFTSDQGVCLMSRVGERGKFQTGLLGIAKQPFLSWQWKETSAPVSFPNLIRIADDHVLVVGGLLDKQARTSVSRLNLETGELTELLAIPTNGLPTQTGVATYGGRVWVSFHSDVQGKKSAHLAEVIVE